MGRRNQRGNGADDVLRRKHIGGGVHRIEKAHHAAQKIVPGKYLRPQVLAAGVNKKNYRGNTHGNAQELTVAAEGVCIVQQRIQVDTRNKEVPVDVEN